MIEDRIVVCRQRIDCWSPKMKLISRIMLSPDFFIERLQHFPMMLHNMIERREDFWIMYVCVNIEYHVTPLVG